MRGYVYQRARFERGLRHSGYLSGEIENRETNGNKSKLLRASLQACFACNCSNLRQHSHSFFSFSFHFSFFFALHFANLIIDDHNKDDNVVHVCFSLHFVFSSHPTHVWFVCLFTHSLHTLRYDRYLPRYTHISIYPPPPPFLFSTLLCFSILPTR